MTVEVHGGVGLISIARPDRLNALTSQTTVELRNALLTMDACREVGAVVLRGEGRAFCAGADLEAGIGDTSFSDPVEAMQAGLRHGTDVIWAMRTIRQPVIAVVHGHAIGAGFALAAAADVRVIGSEAAFSAPFLRLGLTVGDLGLSWFLPRIIGLGRAAELFYSAGVIKADRAVEWGLATHVSADPLTEAMEYAAGVATFPSFGVQTSKNLINAGGSSGLREHLDAEARAQVITGLTGAARRAMSRASERTTRKKSD
ncbi:enoyl-CoA hydratase/isomerase family protein [Dactylosporangium sp. NPDC051484]|uniref:enoyl-CoA hydratase/isomerase family protein n=1 Tax=Dactylosporangium sp. NPDC051484 TaxID=3154942 RepID=UPI00344C7C63